jgi:sensor histidine kinase YesM
LVYCSITNPLHYKRNEENLATMQHITELEQMALKSQMNPHFYF